MLNIFFSHSPKTFLFLIILYYSYLFYPYLQTVCVLITRWRRGEGLLAAIFQATHILFR